MLKKGAASKTIKKILQCFYNCTSITLNIKISFIFSILSLFCTSLEPTPSQASLPLKAESHLGLSILKSNLFLIKKQNKNKKLPLSFPAHPFPKTRLSLSHVVVSIKNLIQVNHIEKLGFVEEKSIF